MSAANANLNSRSSPDAASTAGSAPGAAKPKPSRVLACVLCQQRKVKCNRQFPCANCIKAGLRDRCLPASHLPRQRRRRFPERDLLNHIRACEDLLQQHGIPFKPLHPPAPSSSAAYHEHDGDSDSQEEPHSASPAELQNYAGGPILAKSRTVYAPNDIINSITDEAQKPRDPELDDTITEDEGGESVASVPRAKIFPQDAYESKNYLVFGLRKTNFNLSLSHPKHVHIFRLWQLYLDNVNPLLKITHTPTLQTRIIEAAGDVSKTSPELEALMFGIYCVSLTTIDEAECLAVFGSSKEALLIEYQFACQQALLNCGFLWTSDRDCLTALHLYLTSLSGDADHRSLCSLLGIAIRIAQRMGLHEESANAKLGVFEAEMRRRLWWSLILFDNRIGEISQNRMAMLSPVWDCKVPLNVNDHELRPEMKMPPEGDGKSSEALFVVVRSEVGDALRRSSFHNEFINPPRKAVGKQPKNSPAAGEREMAAVERRIDEQYLRFCTQESPLHRITLWMSQSAIAKNYLLEQYLREGQSPTRGSTGERETVMVYALRMLECDTNLLTSPLTKGYIWLVKDYFPFPAYLNIIQELRERPHGKDTPKLWATMSENFEARFIGRNPLQIDNRVLGYLSKTLLQLWEAQAASPAPGLRIEQPSMISDMQRRVAEMSTPREQDVAEEIRLDVSNPAASYDQLMSSTHRFGAQTTLFTGIGEQYYTDFIAPGSFPLSGQAFTDTDMGRVDWNLMDWDVMGSRS